jgi:dolichol-phosphate mannosyltransferase
MDVLRNMREESRYYRGMVSWVGFNQIGIEYDRDPRYAGTSTFSPMKYFRFAINGITSFTDRPLYFSSVLGIIITLISFIFLFILVAKKIIDPSFSIPGWPSLITLVLFFGGIQLLSIGVVSIYISKIYREVKGRPLYIIEETQNLN